MFEGTVEIEPFQQVIMGLLGGEGFSLPVVTETEAVDVELNFTESAIAALKQNMAGDEQSHVLIISAQSGGCSGYLYDMKIIEDPGADGFQRIDIGGIEVLVHNKDSSMLSGINIDFKETLMGGGFQIENPNADRSCGCGQSFG
ncbi:MAG: iron-sulfur cluster assembly accessory protein [Candidatus Thalassarchaeaceae archaeon]|nr:iron-sulfur cluster assembly accessory protein [Candidatus Thalassarchaeaceae archaeon]